MEVGMGEGKREEGVRLLYITAERAVQTYLIAQQHREMYCLIVCHLYSPSVRPYNSTLVQLLQQLLALCGVWGGIKLAGAKQA